MPYCGAHRAGEHCRQGARYSAGGSSYFADAGIPVPRSSFVYRPEGILLGNIPPIGKVVAGCRRAEYQLGTAAVLANAGAVVQYLTPGFATISRRLVDAHESRFIMKRLRAAGVIISTNTYIKSIGDHSLIVYDVITEEERTLEGVDAVVLSTARIPQDGLTRSSPARSRSSIPLGTRSPQGPGPPPPTRDRNSRATFGEPGAPTTVGEAYFLQDSPEVMPLPAEALLTPGS